MEQKENDEKNRRAACLNMLDNAITVSETTAMRKQEIRKEKVQSKNYKAEAKFYFEDNDFDYWKALESYKDDLAHEVELYSREKDMLKQ